jgi:hypothetical protein
VREEKREKREEEREKREREKIQESLSALHFTSFFIFCNMKGGFVMSKKKLGFAITLAQVTLTLYCKSFMIISISKPSQ